VAGKAEWSAMGLPTEGSSTSLPTAQNALRQEVTTCHIGERVRDVYQRVTAVGGDVALVVDDAGIVLGRLRPKVFAQHPESIVADVMEDGPTTIRPNTKLTDIIPRMQSKNVSSIVVTMANGRLSGILYRQDGEALLNKQNTKAKE
jgi:predicted transcriptional regulator